MISVVKILGNDTVCSLHVEVAGMTLSVLAGFHGGHAIGTVAWDAHDIDMTTPGTDHKFTVWVLADGTIAAAQGPDEPVPPLGMRDRLVWGIIPAGCNDLAQATVNVLTIVPEGGE